MSNKLKYSHVVFPQHLNISIYIVLNLAFIKTDDSVKYIIMGLHQMFGKFYIYFFFLGEKCLVSSPNSAFDFTTPKPIGQDIDQVPGGGYDHTYCLPQSKDFCAE